MTCFRFWKNAHMWSWCAGAACAASLVYLNIKDVGSDSVDFGFSLQLGYPVIFYLRIDHIGLNTGLSPAGLVIDSLFALVLTTSTVRMSRRFLPKRSAFSLMTLMACVATVGSYLWICKNQGYTWHALPYFLSEAMVIVGLLASWTAVCEGAGRTVDSVLGRWRKVGFERQGEPSQRVTSQVQGEKESEEREGEKGR